jgi:hypothetical protein
MRTLLMGVDSGTQSSMAMDVEAGSGSVRTRAGRLSAASATVLMFSGFVLTVASEPASYSDLILGFVSVLLLAGVTAGGSDEKKIKAGRLHRGSIDNLVFKLSLGTEVVALDPGKSWSQVDRFKWVARGLIGAPQSFHVCADGSVEINATRISINDPEGAAKLEHEIGKHHEASVAHVVAPASKPTQLVATPAGPAEARFRVKLDRLGHILIEWGQGVDREETGLRGLATLIANGLIRKPARYHVDALQRGIEIDDVWFACSETGVKSLEEALNTRYAVTAKTDKAVTIEIKENHAASTGFDIHFTSIRAGSPFEVKGHLTQENLDILQDQRKCDLIQPEIHLLLSPPYLLFRRHRPDLGEERIAELPDVNLLRTNAAQLQHILNHPLIRRSGDGRPLHTVGGRPEEIAEIRVVRNPANPALLWLECVTPTGQTIGVRAFTHHNITDFQHGGVFLAHLDVHLSLDHQHLGILNRLTKEEEVISLDTRSSEEDLCRASSMLTKALKPPVFAKLSSTGEEPSGSSSVPGGGLTASAELETTERSFRAARPEEALVIEQRTQGLASKAVGTIASGPQLDLITSLFREKDALRINVEVFRRLSVWLGITPQEYRLSLPRVFEDRHFEVLNFEQLEIQSLMDLRGEDFYGFYLSHISAQKIVLVYACNGTHIEWGPDKCVLQPTARSEVEEYRDSALLGMAQDHKDQFVFIVQPLFKKWIVPREQPYTVENLRFSTVGDIAAAPGDFRLIWPESSAPNG